MQPIGGALRKSTTSSELEKEQTGTLDGRSVIERFRELPVNVMNRIAKYSGISSHFLPEIETSLNETLKKKISLNHCKRRIINEILHLWDSLTPMQKDNYHINMQIAELLPRIACYCPEHSLAIAQTMLKEKQHHNQPGIQLWSDALWQIAHRLIGMDHATYQGLLPTIVEADRQNPSLSFPCIKKQLEYDLDAASCALEKLLEQLDDPEDKNEVLLDILPLLAKQSPARALQFSERIEDLNLKVVGFAKIVMASPYTNQEKVTLICERAALALGNAWLLEETLMTRLEIAKELLPIGKEAALSLLDGIEDAIQATDMNPSRRRSLRSYLVNALAAYAPERAYQQFQLIDDASERNYCLINSISGFAAEGRRWDIALSAALQLEGIAKARSLAMIAQENLDYDPQWKSKLIKILRSHIGLFEKELRALSNPKNDILEEALKRLANADKIVRDFADRFHSAHEAFLHLAKESALAIIGEDRLLGETVLLDLIPLIAQRDILQALDLNSRFSSSPMQAKAMMKTYSVIAKSHPEIAQVILTDTINEAFITQDDVQRIGLLLIIAAHLSL